jgi:hypothetical protein
VFSSARRRYLSSRFDHGMLERPELPVPQSGHLLSASALHAATPLLQQYDPNRMFDATGAHMPTHLRVAARRVPQACGILGNLRL